jgi:hypothetical protein
VLLQVLQIYRSERCLTTILEPLDVAMAAVAKANACEDSSESKVEVSTTAAVEDPSPSPPTPVKRKVQKNKKKCWECKKKVGLTGIECRCRYVFCGQHRYPDDHSCDFDFQTMGKKRLAEANEKIVSSKFERL